MVVLMWPGDLMLSQEKHRLSKIGPCHSQMSFLKHTQAKIDVNTAVVPSYSGYSFGPKSTRKFQILSDT